MAGVLRELPKAAAARFLTSLHQPSHILVAISGGSDSTGLLVALADEIRAGRHGHRLSAATVDHDLRADSADEAKAVGALCKRLGIAHRTRRWEGEKPATGRMAAAREARYALLADVAAEVGADLIVTGHTFDDQQETLTMRSARTPESRIEVATGIADAVLFDRRIWIVRPFLACSRADIRADLIGRGMGWIDDPSNTDLHYERVRVRAGLGERDGDTLPDGGGKAKSDLSAASAAWVGNAVTIHAGLLCRIEIGGLDAGAPAFAYGLSALTGVLGGQPFGLGRDRMQRVLAFLGHGTPGRRTAGGVVFDLGRDGLYLMRESRNIATLDLVPGARGIWDGRFDVRNNSRSVAQIIAGRPVESLPFPHGMPKGAVMRAAASAPCVRFEDDGWQENDEGVTITLRLAPFDRFLTRFDLTLANQLSMSFGGMAYLSPPL